ncbi:4-carboxymuconolactone decarboxylase [Mangrovactinospora gilvigrisea]|uniref:4-carboxymuconolactone decarboxylase n=1 Tax=Mangrovactinospora gilvigrisea TaxID=1428644 RepID=A0A1J7CAV1_9ACTN|nr:carboxymuconolactone decarboxylase family protein [Mangrovactinospora gilvigrisea]OIV38648.1 4-carboxymuconolactone decarboxylase [Mangrovactinospora gilvigrisea]
MAKQSAPQELAGIAPKLVEITDGVLFADVWERPGLSPRDRSLVTVSVLAALYRTEQLPYHLGKALENGLSVEELSEAITHLAFYAGWPNAMTAINQLKRIADEQASA